jgi:RNA polymerase primary sigma factor
MNSSGLDLYFSEIGKLSVPSRAEVQRLCTAIEVGVLAEDRIADEGAPLRLQRELRELQRRGQIAFDELVSRNLKLVVVIAREMAGRFSTLEDLVQAGNVGLMKAVQRFDWRRGFTFATYARWWIRKAVSQELALERVIWIPETPLRRIRDLARSEAELTDQLSRAPTTSEIAAYAGATRGEVADLRLIGNRPLSLDRSVEPGTDLTLVDLIPDKRDDLADALHASRVSQAVRDALHALDPLSARVLSSRFGLGDRPPRTVRRTARELRLSVADTVSIERDALVSIGARIEQLRDMPPMVRP